MINHLSLAVAVFCAVLGCGGSKAEQGLRSDGAERGSSGGVGALPAPLGLRVATWNLEWLNRKNGTGPVKRDDRDYERLRRYADKLNADVIAFQEVDGEPAAQRVFSPDTYSVYVAVQNDPQRVGFAYRKSLHVSIHPDYAALDVGQVRSGADISVTYQGRTLRLLSVHLKSGCFDGRLEQGASKECQKLAMQLPSLEQWIDARGAENAPAIVLGDFNRRFFAKPDDPFWREIDDGKPAASDLWSPTEGQRARCWGGKYPDFIDHIVFNAPARALLSADSFTQLVYDDADREHKGRLSDHCPLAITLSGPPLPRAPGTTHGDAPSAPAKPPPPPETRIKGNINGAGRKLYHAPGCPDYPRTQIDEGKGERWFDSRAAAEAAGWARASNCQ
ncbi:MAG: endonuclease/exonuclease/phosphatase family protein [Polyangiales bacterium]